MAMVQVTQNKLEWEEGEAYRTLRTNLKFCGEDKQVIAITSCTPNEGKSSVALQLSVSLAESGKKVLMVDADMRKFALLGRVRVESETLGLSHYLSRQVKLTEIINATDVPNFNLIFAGPVPPNPTELLGSKAFMTMVNTAEKVYDYILIDTPPLGSVIDSAVICEACDGVILLIEAGVISYRFAQDMKQQLEKTNCPILGAILNKVDYSKQKYYGKYYTRYEKYGV